ncbi:hypothetical protein MOUN0_L05534 [Monosporozyma unispora]
MSKSANCNCNCDLLLWKNPIETGKYFFGSILTLLILKKVNLITFFLKLFYTIFLTTGTIEFLSKAFLGQGLITKYGIKECPNTVAIIKPYFDEFLKNLPVKQAKFRMLVFAQVPKNTFKAALIAFALHKLFSWFSVWTILFVSVLAMFTLPIVYVTYQKEIDSMLNCACTTIKTKSNQICNQICNKVEPTIKKIGPLNTLLNNYKQKQGISNDSTTTKLAAEVPISSSTSTGIDLPNVPNSNPESTSTKEFNDSEIQHENVL